MLDSTQTCDLSGDRGATSPELTDMKSNQVDINHLLSAVDTEMTLGSEKGDPTERQLNVKLEDRTLWEKFKEYTNEMIVTKNGRRMFPVFRVSVSGVDPNAMYTLLLDFVQVDNHRWKYVNGDWVPGGKAEPAAPNCVYIHPDSPNFGAHWMKEPLSFSKVKLTNKLNGGGQESSDQIVNVADVPCTPHIVVIGDSLFNSEKCLLYVDSSLIMEVSDVKSAIAVQFAAFFIFSIQFPKEAAKSLDFFQRFILKMKDQTEKKKRKLNEKIMLNSLHKYEPRIHIVRVNSRTQKKSIMTFSFPETQFIAVTAYQNEEITSLKIKHNPFAKAFLDAKERPEQRDFIDDPLMNDQRTFSHLTGTWYLPPGSHALVPPPAHQFTNPLGLSNPHGCDRLSLRNPRPSPYSHPYQRRSPPGNFSRDMGSNLPMLNLTENWAHMSAGSHSMLPSNPSSSQGNYGMWMSGAVGNLSPNQNCAMPYLRTSAPYSFPSSTTTVTSIPSVPSASSVVSQASYEHPCDISTYSVARDSARTNWSPLTPPPL